MAIRQRTSPIESPFLNQLWRLIHSRTLGTERMGKTMQKPPPPGSRACEKHVLLRMILEGNKVFPQHSWSQIQRTKIFRLAKDSILLSSVIEYSEGSWPLAERVRMRLFLWKAVKFCFENFPQYGKVRPEVQRCSLAFIPAWLFFQSSRTTPHPVEVIMGSWKIGDLIPINLGTMQKSQVDRKREVAWILFIELTSFPDAEKNRQIE